MNRLNTILFTVLGVAVVGTIGAAAFVYSGAYNVGADDPHTRPTYAVLETLRQRSIQAHAAGIKVPDLSDPQLILKGAGQYAAMCTECHLKPGQKESELRPGLYPQPPNLSQTRIDPAQAFWVIKHGVKMSAMPAWGSSHDDMTIWSMVAFLQKLPELTPAAYKTMVAQAPPDDDMDMDDDRAGHSHGEPGDAMPGSMAGMAMPGSSSSSPTPHDDGTGLTAAATAASSSAPPASNESTPHHHHHPAAAEEGKKP